MDVVEFQEKMNPTHRASLCQMLKMKQLPECLLEQYAQVKKMADRVDGLLIVGELAIIALRAGFDPDTGKFSMTGKEEKKAAIAADKTAIPVGQTTEGEDARLQAAADEMAVKKDIPPASEQTGEQMVDEAVRETLEQTEKEAAEKNAVPVEAPTMTGAEVEAAIASGAARPVGSGKFWAPGMPVTVLHEEELAQGNIVGVHPPEPGSGKVVQLTVDLGEGKMITVDEDEADAV